eukprot:PhM_4_TR10422/c0_g1_i1/m.58991
MFGAPLNPNTLHNPANEVSDRRRNTSSATPVCIDLPLWPRAAETKVTAKQSLKKSDAGDRSNGSFHANDSVLCDYVRHALKLPISTGEILPAAKSVMKKGPLKYSFNNHIKVMHRAHRIKEHLASIIDDLLHNHEGNDKFIAHRTALLHDEILHVLALPQMHTPVEKTALHKVKLDVEIIFRDALRMTKDLRNATNTPAPSAMEGVTTDEPTKRRSTSILTASPISSPDSTRSLDIDMASSPTLASHKPTTRLPTDDRMAMTQRFMALEPTLTNMSTYEPFLCGMTGGATSKEGLDFLRYVAADKIQVVPVQRSTD